MSSSKKNQRNPEESNKSTGIGFEFYKKYLKKNIKTGIHSEILTLWRQVLKIIRKILKQP